MMQLQAVAPSGIPANFQRTALQWQQPSIIASPSPTLDWVRKRTAVAWLLPRDDGACATSANLTSALHVLASHAPRDRLLLVVNYAFEAQDAVKCGAMLAELLNRSFTATADISHEERIQDHRRHDPGRYLQPMAAGAQRAVCNTQSAS
jgi:hypothetical protein